MSNITDVFAARSNLFSLVCSKSGKPATEPTVRNPYSESGGVFEIRYHEDRDSIRELPLARPDEIVDLGQGNTPMVALDDLAGRLGIAKLCAKLEFCSPTGSFKDRGSAMLISAAKEEGISEFVEDSSGNAGASMAAYAAKAGMHAHIFAPSTAANGKLDQIRIFGAELHLIDGPRQAATDAAVEFAESQDIPYLSHAYSPWFAEGVKTMAWEISDSQIDATDIVAPAGNGALLIGAYAGFSPANRPRIHCVQSEAVQPLIRAINGEEWDAKEAKPTIASGISVSLPPRAYQAARAVVDSGASAVVVSDAAMRSWQRRLASEVGIFCEVTSAAAFAGLEKLVELGKIDNDARVVVPMTGSGLKEPL